MVVIAVLAVLFAQDPATPVEEDFYRVLTLPSPEGVVLEVGGIALLPDARPIVCTRRGELYVVENAYAEDPGEASFRLIAEGLHEPLGLLVRDGWIYCAQRAEITRMRDVDGDDRIDEFECVADSWDISGNYHEYNFGPRMDREGKLWITTNKPFGSEPFGRVDWRGFALRFAPDGTMEPVACGLRSPAGIELSPFGEMFYTDNQGEWCGASKLSHLEPGDFHGHPWGVFSCRRPEWPYPAPENAFAQEGKGVPMGEVAQSVPTFKLPAVWFPYDKMGRSPSGFDWDPSAGKFGPFAGQVFVGDQYAATVMRVFLEQVEGHWQGACFPFRSGLMTGVVRLAWGADASLFVGGSDRGWPTLGYASYGMQRLVWTGRVPFEIERIHARPDGFELIFTTPVDPHTAADVASYQLSSYTYLLHSTYGSAEQDTRELVVLEAQSSPDQLGVRLTIEGLRPAYVHEIHAPGVRSAQGQALLHDAAYYTLIEIPGR